MPDNRYSLNLEISRDSDLDKAISKLIEDRLLSIIRSEVDKKFNQYIRSVSDQVMSKFTPDKIQSMVSSAVSSKVSYGVTHNDLESALLTSMNSVIDKYLPMNQDRLDRYFETKVNSFCAFNLDHIIKDRIENILGSSIQEDVIKAIVKSLTSDK